MKGFTLERLISILQEHPEQVEGEIFEMLTSLGDFLVFKQMMLDFKAVGSLLALNFYIHTANSTIGC